MGVFRKKHLVIALAGAWLSTGALAATCSYKNFTIGYEISALRGPDSNDRFLFGVSPLRCDSSGTVIYDSGMGFSDGYEMGWYTEEEIRNTLMSSYLYNVKAFEGQCRLHYIGVHRYYRGTIANVNIDTYALRTAPYLRVFDRPLHLPVGEDPSIYLRDALGEQSTNVCSMPPQRKDPQECVGNPIEPGKGCKVQKETDYTAAGISPLEFVRYYDSENPYHYLSALRRPMGNRWRHNHEVLLNPKAGANLVLMFREDGKILNFRPKTGSTTAWVGDADVVGQLTKTASGWTYRDAEDSVETFDTAGKRLTRVLRDGRSLSFTYDGNGRLSDIQDNFGQTLRLAYNTAGFVSELTDPSGQKTAFDYDAQGTVTKVTYPDTKVRTYSYTSLTVGSNVEPALLTGMTDENGAPFAAWSYDASALATSSEHAGGVDKYSLSYQKDASGKITGATITNPLNAVSQYTFQEILGVRKLRNETHPLLSGVSRSYTYDVNGNLASVTDFNGSVTQYYYDLSRNLETKRVEGYGRSEAQTVTTEWHAIYRLPTRIAEPLKLTNFTYDNAGNLLTKTEQATNDANGSQGFGAGLVGTPRVWKWTYNQYGQVLTADGTRTDVSDVTTYTYYDAADPDPAKRGQLATVANALGHLTQVTAYDANGRPLTVVDPNGVATQLQYDVRGRLTGKTVGGEAMAYQYDGAGLLTRVTFSDGSYLAYTYDSAHRLTGLADALGNQVRYTLDAAGNRTREEVRDPANQLALLKQRVFDGLSRLASELGAQGQTLAQYAYDASDNMTGITTPGSGGNRTTTQAFDALHRLVQVVDPQNGIVRYGYDGQDRNTQVIDPRGLVTNYTVDGLGNRTQETSPDTGTTARSFDAAGNVLTRTDAKGQVITYQYDALNRLTQVAYADGSSDVYTWDQGVNGTGRLTRVDQRDAAGSLRLTIEYAYDAQGRRIQEARTLAGRTYTTGYRYVGGRLTGLTYPSGRRLDYTLNAAGRPSAIQLTDLDGQVKVIASQITYAPFGGVRSLTNGAGQTLSWSEDADGRPTAYTLGGQTWQIGYDASARPAYQTNLADAAQTASYGYDDLDRLIQGVLPTTIHGYSYDADGNRTSQTVGATARTFTPAANSNRLLGITGNNPQTYSYDATGNLTTSGAGATYTYDARGRMVSSTTAAGVTVYHVDPLGQRVRKTNAREDSLYHYDGAGHLLSVTAPDGSPREDILWLGQLPLAVLR